MNVTEEEAREQVQRVLDSEFFQTSETQRRLLKYLADKSLSGATDQLKEYTIGVDALGRPESYDPQRDSTVRFQAGKLRQKILEYYQTAGQADPVLIGFPRGHFKLHFTRRELRRIAPGRRSRALVASLAALVIVAAMAVYWRTSLVRLERATAYATEAWQPALEEFWAPFLATKSPTTVCVGTPMFARMPSVGFIREPETMNRTWDEAMSSKQITKLRQTFPGKPIEPWYAFTGIGEAGGAFLLSKLLSARIPDLQFASSNTLTWNDIGANNLVFVGPSKFNLQIRQLPVEQALSLDTVEDDGVLNLKPLRGEPSLFESVMVDPPNFSGRTYALISRLPGLHKRGHILILAGPWVPGSLAAAQYVTAEPYARELLGRIRLPSGKLPPYYQVLISVKFEHWTPVQISYVLHRVLKAD